ncbi:MAG: ATP-dependent DNA helicase RecQ, partial [Planctomycetales bacterium]|nr:ATP-dependent DNA helicase RecQ [Planctomycetales bacterium]
LVVSPLISLMKDQIDALTARQIDAARLDHSLSEEDYGRTLERARQGQLRLLYVSPERFNNERFRESLQSMQVALMAIDEAHCISEWGHNFRPDYLKLPHYARSANVQRILALTATATPAVLNDICRQFEIAPENAIRTGFYRENLALHFVPIDNNSRDGTLSQLLKQQPPGPTIVYVTQQRTAEQLAGQLADEQFAARAYHAGLDADTRASLQDWFMQSDEAVMVATIAFGMGIDKANIRYVYHYNLPKCLEGYAQEIGRAGRDGLMSSCCLLANPADRVVLENFVYGDTPSLQAINDFVREVFAHPTEFEMSHYDVSFRCDIRILVVQTLLTYLQADGWLEAGTPRYAEYRFQPQHPSVKILGKFSGERREFLASLFRQARQARTWFHIDLQQATQRLKTTRDRIVRALDYLAQQGDIQLKASGLRHRYRCLRKPTAPAELSLELHEKMTARETAELERIDQVLALIQSDGCQTKRLGAHFGEPLGADCGHCTWCLNGHEQLKLPDMPRPAIDASVVRNAKALVSEHTVLQQDVRNVAKFLCGLTSPRLQREKLTRHPLFGSLSHVPFAQVVAEF